MNKLFLGITFVMACLVHPSASFADLPKGITIVQKPIYYIKPPAKSKNGLRVSAWVNNGNNTYNSGENIEVFVRTNRDAYITIINVGSSGDINQIYPNAHQRSNLVKAHTTVKIPGKEAPFVFKVNGPKGADLIKVIASESASPIIANQFLTQSIAFPKITRNTGQLAKDISAVLKKPAHRGAVHVSDKVIYIR